MGFSKGGGGWGAEGGTGTLSVFFVSRSGLDSDPFGLLNVLSRGQAAPPVALKC
jgi:hypothetical protein